MSKLFTNEPALVIGAIQAVIVLGTAFGLKLTTTQTGAIVTFATALLAIAAALATRTQVTPVATLPLANQIITATKGPEK